MYTTYPLMKYVSFLMNKVNDTVPKEPMIDMFLKTIWEKYGANVLTLCKGLTLKNREHNIIKVDISSNKLTYLCISWWWRRNTYNMRDNQYSVGLGCSNANVCKRSKTQQQEEPVVLDAINKIVSLKSSMKRHLPLYWFIAKIQCFPVA